MIPSDEADIICVKAAMNQKLDKWFVIDVSRVMNEDSVVGL